MPRKDTIQKITDSEVRARAMDLQELADRLNTAKTPEQKNLEKALSTSSDDSVKEFLSAKIADLANSDVPEVAEIAEAIEAIGYNPIDILRAGVKKTKDNATTDDRKAELDTIANAMRTEKSAEEKNLEALLKTTDDESIKSFVRDKLSEMSGEVSLSEAIDMVEDIDENVVDTFRAGLLKKVANLITWNSNQQEK